jgi:hypothetical protein
VDGAILKTVLLLCLAAFLTAACSEETEEPETDAASREGAGEVQETRTMPESGALVQGRYSTGERFEPPFSLELGEGWRVLSASQPYSLKLGYVAPGTVVAEGKVLTFLDVQEVFEPHGEESEASFQAKPAPGNLVAWFQRHPYLATEEPEPVEIGGEPGERFDALVNVPEGYRDAHGGGCPVPCIPLLRPGGGAVTHMTEKGKNRFAVLESVGDEAFVIIVSAPVGEFDEFLPRARETLDTLEWEGD